MSSQKNLKYNYLCILYIILTNTFSVNAKVDLRILDDFSRDSRSNYVTNLKDNTFTLSENSWRIENNRLYPAPVDREKQWFNDKTTNKSATLFRKNEYLEPGQAISIDIFYSKNAWKYPKMGLTIQDVTFSITPGDAGYFLGLKNKEYELNAELNVDRTLTLTLVRGINNTSNTIYWCVKEKEIEKKGECAIDNLPLQARLGIYFDLDFRETQREYYFSNFKYGSMTCNDLPNYDIAQLTMRSKLPQIFSNNTKVFYDSTSKDLTQKELNSLVQWAINEPGQWSNHGNRMLNTHTELFKVYKVYQKSKDLRILNHLIDIANIALDSRNDRNKVIGTYKTLTGYNNNRWTYDYAPSWPHFMGWQLQDGERYYFGDVGEDAIGVHYMALAALSIANTPNIWNKKINGKTYKEIALNFIKEANKTVKQSIIPKYIDPNTYESIYQYERYRNQTKVLDKGGYVPFNRFWHVIVAFASLNPAMEVFNIDAESVKLYDRISMTSINRWLNSMDHMEKHGYKVLDYPYCYPSQKIYNDNPSKWNFLKKDFNGFPSEDLNHLGCDASELYVMYFSKRYKIPDNILMEYANALYVLDFKKKENYFPYTLVGGGKGKYKAINESTYFFTLFQSKLKESFWNNKFQDKEKLSKEELFIKLMKSIK